MKSQEMIEPEELAKLLEELAEVKTQLANLKKKANIYNKGSKAWAVVSKEGKINEQSVSTSQWSSMRKFETLMGESWFKFEEYGYSCDQVIIVREIKGYLK